MGSCLVQEYTHVTNCLVILEKYNHQQPLATTSTAYTSLLYHIIQLSVHCLVCIHVHQPILNNNYPLAGLPPYMHMGCNVYTTQDHLFNTTYVLRDQGVMHIRGVGSNLGLVRQM